MASKLTEKQKRFVDEYLIDLNATQAAIRSGYSIKNAFKIGSELLQKTTVQDQLQKRIKSREKRTEITQDKVLAEWAKIGFANITDYLEYKTIMREIGRTDDNDPIYDWAMSVIAKESSEVDGAPIQEVSVARDGTFKFKLYSKLDALDKIGQHLGMFDKKGGGDIEDLTSLAELLNNDTDEDDRMEAVQSET